MQAPIGRKRSSRTPSRFGDGLRGILMKMYGNGLKASGLHLRWAGRGFSPALSIIPEKLLEVSGMRVWLPLDQGLDGPHVV